MTQPVSKQSAAERLFTLTCCLMAAPVIGLSKRDIFASVSSYAQQASEMAKEKMFDRDKTALRDMGVALEVLDSLSFEEGDTARYRIARGSFSWPKDFVINAEHLALLELAAKAWNNQLLSKSAHSGLTGSSPLALCRPPGSSPSSPQGCWLSTTASHHWLTLSRTQTWLPSNTGSQTRSRPCER